LKFVRCATPNLLKGSSFTGAWHAFPALYGAFLAWLFWRAAL